MLTACGFTTSQPSTPINHNRAISPTLFYGSTIHDWPMFGYNPGHTGYVDQAVTTQAVHGRLLWSQRLHPIFSSPIAGLDMLFVASTDGYIYALHEESGEIVWRTQLNTYLTDATPVLEGQIIFVAAHSTALEALDARTGQFYWLFETSEKIQAPPLIVGNHVLLASRTTLWAINATNGQLLWKFHRGAAGWPTTGSPTVAGNTAYFWLGSETSLWAVNLQNGHPLWSFDTGDRITSTPLVQGETVYLATWHGLLFALNKANGQKRWSYSLNPGRSQGVVDGVGGNMALARGYLYVGDYRGSILCLSASKGQLMWSYATGAQVLATPIIASSLVYVGSGDGYFYAIAIQSGRPVWRYPTGEVRNSASLAYNHLYVGSINGMIYAFA